MNKLALILLLVAFIAVESLADKDDDLWKSYKAEHGKKHHPKEEAGRKANFLATQKKIEKHNKENKKWQMGHNKFSDMTAEEKKAVLGAVPLKKPERQIPEVRVIEERDVPTSYDLRNDSCLQPVKDQGWCGSCWAFSTTPSIEFSVCKKTGGSVSLSEQQLVDCDTKSGGCNGGWYFWAWDYLIKTGQALSTAAAYPYSSGSSNTAGTCKVTTPGAAGTPRVASWAWTYPWYQAAPIMSDLVTYGPIPVALKVIDSFFQYKSGIYEDPLCNSSYGDINHAVVIVGYGTRNGTPYWIVRNSWSKYWGDGGYFLIKRGTNQCQIESWSAYVQLVK